MFNIVRVMQRTTSPHNGVCEVGEGAVCGRDSEDMMAIWSGVYVHGEGRRRRRDGAKR
jgi:hypothetical protein